MIHLYIDLEEGFIGIQNDEIEQQVSSEIIPDSIAWMGRDIDDNFRLASISMKNIDLYGMEFVLTDKGGNVFASNMIGSSLFPSEPSLPRCEKHGGKVLPDGYFCLECFKEATKRRLSRREKRIAKPN